MWTAKKILRNWLRVCEGVRWARLRVVRTLVLAYEVFQQHRLSINLHKPQDQTFLVLPNQVSALVPAEQGFPLLKPVWSLDLYWWSVLAYWLYRKIGELTRIWHWNVNERLIIISFYGNLPRYHYHMGSTVWKIVVVLVKSLKWLCVRERYPLPPQSSWNLVLARSMINKLC